MEVPSGNSATGTFTIKEWSCLFQEHPTSTTEVILINDFLTDSYSFTEQIDDY
jgi:hypothetical protein